MARGVTTVAPVTHLEEASHILVHERIKCLPVLDQGRVIGIVSRACAGYLVYLFSDDERKGRTEGPVLMSSYAEEESARHH